MTATAQAPMSKPTFTDKLRHAAKLIDSLGVTPISISNTGSDAFTVLLQLSDYKNIVIPKYGGSYVDDLGNRYYETEIGGVSFTANEHIRNYKRVTLPRITTEEIEC